LDGITNPEEYTRHGGFVDGPSPCTPCFLRILSQQPLQKLYDLKGPPLLYGFSLSSNDLADASCLPRPVPRNSRANDAAAAPTHRRSLAMPFAIPGRRSPNFPQHLREYRVFFRKLRAASSDTANLHGPLKPRIRTEGFSIRGLRIQSKSHSLTLSSLNPLRAAWPDGAAAPFSCSSFLCMWSPSARRAPRLDGVSVDFPAPDACTPCPSTIFSLALAGALLTDCCVLDEDSVSIRQTGRTGPPRRAKLGQFEHRLRASLARE